VLRGTLAELPELAVKAGAGPALVLLGQVLGATAARACTAIEDIEALKRSQPGSR